MKFSNLRIVMLYICSIAIPISAAGQGAAFIYNMYGLSYVDGHRVYVKNNIRGPIYFPSYSILPLAGHFGVGIQVEAQVAGDYYLEIRSEPSNWNPYMGDNGLDNDTDPVTLAAHEKYTFGMGVICPSASSYPTKYVVLDLKEKTCWLCGADPVLETKNIQMIVDADPPVTYIDIGNVSETNLITVNFGPDGGSDRGSTFAFDGPSGMWKYDVQYSENNVSWTSIPGSPFDATKTSATLQGSFGKTYFFRIRGYDNVGNIETYHGNLSVNLPNPFIGTTSNPTNGGSTTGGGTYNLGASATVKAIPAANYSFVNWTEKGSPVSSNANYSFTVSSNRSLVANFQQTVYTISTSSSPSGGGTASGGGNYNSGAQATVSASPAANYRFVNWTENGSQVSNNANYSFIVSGNRTLVANFRLITYTISTSSNPANGGTTSGGGSYNSGSSAVISATPATNYHFVNWTENGSVISSNASYSFTVNGNWTFVANFQADVITYSINTSSNPANGGTTSGGGTYNSGTTATVSATPAANYSFVNWTENGNQVSTNASYSFSVTGNRTLVANFKIITYTVTISSNPTNGGTTSGGGTYNSGTTATVSATPAANYSFVNWTENGNQISTNASYSFSVTGNRTLVANFKIITYTLSTSSNPTNGGTTSGGGTYNSGSSAIISAVPAANYHFVNWTENGNQVSSNASYTFVVNGNRIFVANFQADAITYSVNTSSNPANGGTTSGGGTYNSGSSAIISAVPAANYHFVNWTENGTPISSNASYTFVVNGNRSFVANFQADALTYTVNTSSNPANGGSTSGSGTYNSGTTAIVSAIPTANYSFVNWTENGNPVSANASYSFSVTGNRTLVANFKIITYTVSTSSNPTNGGTTSEGGTYNSGSSAIISAVPAANYHFVNWTENGSPVSSNASYTFVVNGNRSFVANFQADALTYTVNTSSNPANGGSTSGSGTYNSGTTAIVSAIPTANYSFVNWTENGNQVSTNASYSFSVTGNRTLVAVFQADDINYTISTSSNPSGGGTISGGGTFKSGTSATVIATPAANYNFVNWTENGIIVSSSASYTFTVSGNRSIVAVFQLKVYTISTTSNPPGAGSITGGGSYNSGTQASITATPAPNYVFVNWTENGTPVSVNSGYTFTVTGNRTLVANFGQNAVAYDITASSNPSEGGTTVGGGTYNSGTSITVSATPALNYNFINWTENGVQVSTNSNFSFIVSGNRTLLANFSTNCYDAYEPDDDYPTTNTSVFSNNFGSSGISKSVAGTVFPAGDYDFYRINVTNPGILKVNMPVAPKNYSIQLYNANKKFLGISTASDPVKSYQISSSGYYYIIVSSYPNQDYSCNPYSLNVNWEPTATPILQATPSQLNFGNLTINTTSGSQSFQLSGINLNGNISLSTPEGFEISASSGGSYSHSLDIIPTNNAVNSLIFVRFVPTQIKTYNSNISINSNGANTAYVIVTGDGINCVDSYEPNEDGPSANTSVFSDNFGTTSVTKNLSSTVYPAGDYDFYRINITHSGTLKVSLPSAPNNFSVQLFDEQGVYYGISMASDPQKSYQLSATGYYFIVVSSYPTNNYSCTNYVLNAEWTPLNTCTDFYEPNNSFESAKTLLIDNLGTTVYRKNFGGTIDNISDNDFFVLNISTTGTINAAITNPPVDLDFELYNSDYVWITGSYTTGSEHFTSSITQPGKYYLIVSNFKKVSSCDNYNVNFDWTPTQFCADAYEPNNSTGNATSGIIDPLGSGYYNKTIIANIHAPDDWDNYKIVNSKEGILEITMNNPPADFRLEFVDVNRNILATSSKAGNEMISYTVKSAGTYYIRVLSSTGGYSCSNYYLDITWNSVLNQTISFNQLINRIYGDLDFEPAATSSSGLPVSYFTDNQAVATVIGGKIHLMGAGVCSITAFQNGNSDYSPAPSVTRQLIVNKANLSAIAENKSRCYGISNPELTVVYSGFVNSDNYLVLDIPPAAITNANNTSSPGSYPIVMSGGNDNNYNIGLNNGIINIEKGIITAAAENKIKTYGSENPVLTVQYNGFANNENYTVLDILPSINTSANIISEVGSYPIALSGGVDNNYNFILSNGSLTINKAPITVAADNQSKIQGEENPEFTSSYSGFMNGENESVIDSKPDIFCPADNSSPEGEYPLIVSGGNDNNYDFEYINGILTITGKPTATIDFIRNSILLYPNPLSDYLNIKFQLERADKIYCEISDYQGRTVLSYSFKLQDKNHIETIDISEMPAGLYNVKIYTHDWYKVDKIIKIK